MADLRGMRLLSSLHLGSNMAGGEGLAVHMSSDRGRTLFVASEHPPADFVAVDVNDPRSPEVVYSHEFPDDRVRSNNLSIFEDLLAVTRQPKKIGDAPAGVEFFDISKPSEPRSISFFDTSGPNSVGTHFVWLGSDGFAYLATAGLGFVPRDGRDRFAMRIVDVSSPSRPSDVGGWWIPGVAETDEVRPPARPADRLAASRCVSVSGEERSSRRFQADGLTSWDFGLRVHNVAVLPEQPDRAFVACTSGGAFILDISDRTHPVTVGSVDYAMPLPGACHTFVPLGTSGFAVISDETLEEGAADFPQKVWIVDARIEDRPMIVGTLEPPWPPAVPERGRFGAHNLHEYPPGQGALRSFDMVASASFGLGVTVFDTSVPLRPREIASFVPGTNPERPGTGQLNDVFIDDRSVIYAVDRGSDLCFALELDRV